MTYVCKICGETHDDHVMCPVMTTPTVGYRKRRVAAGRPSYNEGEN